MSITLTLPNVVAPPQFMLVTVAVATAPNSDCTQPGVPFACCSGAGTGTCQDASSGTIVVPPGWTEIRHDSCGTDLQMSLAYRIVQPGDSGVSQFDWGFLGAGQPADSSSCTGFGAPDACCTGEGTGTCPYSPFLASGGLTLFSNVDTVTPIEDALPACTMDGTAMTAPSITTTEDSSLVLLAYGIVGDNDSSKPTGYSLIYLHSIGNTGPYIANYATTKPILASGTVTADQVSNASFAGDSLGYQVGLSPPLP